MRMIDEVRLALKPEVLGGPYIISMGTGATKMSANPDLITMETHVQQAKTIENQFFIHGPKCEKNVYNF